MSFNRKNWSALSSLAQQWSAEDEEEQERERRRRYRQQSSVSEAKEETSSIEKQNAVNQAPLRFSCSPEAKQSKLGSSKQERERTLVDTINEEEEEEDRSVRRRIEIFNHMKDKNGSVNTRKLEKDIAGEKVRPLPKVAQKQKVAVVETCEGLTQKGPSREKQENLVQEPKEATLVEKQKILNQEEKERIPAKDEKLDREVKEPQKAKDEVFHDEEKAPNAHNSPKLAALQNDVTTQQPQRASWERRSISRLEVKIQPRARNFTETASATTSSRPQVTEKSIPKSTDEAVNVSSNQGGYEASVFVSRPMITYSSSFKRVTPRTISFRVVSKKDKQDDTVLSRSASMRLPASTGKLEEKLEKYTSAVQRAESIKLTPSARRNFQPPLEGVASKRSIFETSLPSRVEPATLIRKESLKIPGGVSSRINLWISRTQEPSKDEGTKDVRRIENVPQQNEWGKQSADS